MTCPKCFARIQPNEEHEAVDGFHEPCYRQWIFELYRQLNGQSVKCATAQIGA